MASGERHVFRFFVDVPGEPGMRVPLSDVDRRHGHVLRLADGDRIEVVDASGVVWTAAWVDGAADLVVRRATGVDVEWLELYAMALTGGAFDELVDASVQAGATSITPVAATRRDAERLTARRARLERIAQAAARQAKRTMVPHIDEPISPDDLPTGTGIVVDPTAPQPLDDVVRSLVGEGVTPMRLLVGGSDGLDAQLVMRLVEAGWRRGRLGPTILRSQLAAPVAVAIAAMLAPQT
jgi:16S rRNA (uracil1498-N3)-methyltransferase